MFEGLLPIGTVVLLKNSTKRVMIIGVLQKQATGDKAKIWDYSACVFPEGFMGPDQTYLFDAEQIAKVYSIGYQDEEQLEFKAKIDSIRTQVRQT